jgi:cyclic beta-1,2-glucan synthetase
MPKSGNTGTSSGGARIAGALALVASGIAIGYAVSSTYEATGGRAILSAALAAGLATGFFSWMKHGLPLVYRDLFEDAVVVAVIAALASPTIAVWQSPVDWEQALGLSQVGAAMCVALYLSIAIAAAAGQERALTTRRRALLLGVPVLANLLLLLSSPTLLEQIGRWLTFAAPLPAVVVTIIARVAVLVAFNLLFVVGVGQIMDRRWTRDPRLLALLSGSAAYAVATPWIAHWGSTTVVTGLPGPICILGVIAATMLAQSGLWAQTFVVTGVAMDALRGRRPNYYKGARHWREGANKAAVYSGLFMAILQGAGAITYSPSIATLLQRHPLAAGTIGGALLFPLAKTIVESFDGSPPFFRRLHTSIRMRENYLRGSVVGLGVAWTLAGGLDFHDAPARFGHGFVIGALAYAGVDMLSDVFAILLGRRRHLQSVRIYGLGAVLGGIVAGSLAWYFDPPQLAAVTGKFRNYVTIDYSIFGVRIEPYVIYPLFSKWGALDLGSVSGGASLFFSESLSGVINWSLAAPLFSINLVLLTALVERSWSPLRALLTKNGMVGVVEQAFRVQRWGLWMAPVIYSLLRMAPEPTWYNQDGAIRTLVAISKGASLGVPEFRAWSLEVFLGLLAYDWLRVLIWFDHMGLRVATLVNASFVVGDALDEKAAHFLGHSMKFRIVPEGIRRFATWGPLLIPFYIPRGAEWEYVWNRSDVVRAEALPLSPPVGSLVSAYATAAAAALLFCFAIMIRRRIGSRLVAAAGPADHPPVLSREFSLGNGVCSLDLRADGCGFSRALSKVRHGAELDLTCRPNESHPLRGKFFYLRELGPDGEPLEPAWSATFEPTRHAAADYAADQPKPTTVRVINGRGGIKAQTTVTVAASKPVELWSLRLTNHESRPRTVELTSYREFALGDREACERHPAYHAMHVGTWFVRTLGAVLAYNRKLGNGGKDITRRHLCRDVAFHAVHTEENGPVRLVGYEDSRSLFIGAGSLRRPDALENADLRAVDDEGLAYTFDPAASLQLHVDIPAHGSVEVRFADGYATSEYAAAKLIARYLGTTLPPESELNEVFGKSRLVLDRHGLDPDRLGYSFSADGNELHTTWDTSRPWSHVIGNALGHGAVISNDGSIFSFAGNSQQNGLTPFLPDSIPAQTLGQAIYVVDLESGAIDTATYAPMRSSHLRHDVVFGRGYACFRKRGDDTALELTAFVPPAEPVEIRVFRIKNRGSKTRRYRIVPYFEIVLAELARDSRGRLETVVDPTGKAIFFSSPHNQFQRGHMFVAWSLAGDAHETSRSRFLGGGGRDLSNPWFVEHGEPDPRSADDGLRIAAFSGYVEIAGGSEAEITVVLGQTRTLDEAQHLIAHYTDAGAANHALQETKAWWERTLSVLRVETNVPEFDRLVNDWLPYQLLTSRLWGRTGPSQRSGGYGFRDQLQDVLPLAGLHPELARKQILLNASQQFLRGDVLQWWHESWEGKPGLGARNHASDPHLWLIHVVDQYVAATGDRAILDMRTPYLEGPHVPLSAGGVVFVPRVSRDDATVYEHCRLAIERTLRHRGANGLPLLECGDWNDGLDELGAKGRGESVWLGFFFYDCLERFAAMTRARGDAAQANRYEVEAMKLREALARMWREDRYVRLVTDGGNEISFASALMSSWPAISGAADFERALAAARSGLAVLEQEHMVLLLHPPFDEASVPHPGKIADYPPGVRENAGQYSHGASWLVDALTKLADLAAERGDESLAAELRADAVRVWIKISPIEEYTRDRIDRYGLPPHQQPADVYFGDGYSGRGGWSWYTGAAARMLTAAHGILGLQFKDGKLVLAGHAGKPKGRLQLRRVVHHGNTVFHHP